MKISTLLVSSVLLVSLSGCVSMSEQIRQAQRADAAAMTDAELASITYPTQFHDAEMANRRWEAHRKNKAAMHEITVQRQREAAAKGIVANDCFSIKDDDLQTLCHLLEDDQ